MTTLFLADEGREEYHYKLAIIGPPAKRYINGFSLAGWWWPIIKCWLGSFLILQGIRASIAKEPYIFVIFQWGPDPLSPPSLDQRMMSPFWIRSCKLILDRSKTGQQCINNGGGSRGGTGGPDPTWKVTKIKYFSYTQENHIATKPAFTVWLSSAR